MERRRTVNIPQACVVAGVSRRTIYYWLKNGTIEVARTTFGSVLIFEDTLPKTKRRIAPPLNVEQVDQRPIVFNVRSA